MPKEVIRILEEHQGNPIVNHRLQIIHIADAEERHTVGVNEIRSPCFVKGPGPQS